MKSFPSYSSCLLRNVTDDGDKPTAHYVLPRERCYTSLGAKKDLTAAPGKTFTQCFRRSGHIPQDLNSLSTWVGTFINSASGRHPRICRTAKITANRARLARKLFVYSLLQYETRFLSADTHWLFCMSPGIWGHPVFPEIPTPAYGCYSSLWNAAELICSEKTVGFYTCWLRRMIVPWQRGQGHRGDFRTSNLLACVWSPVQTT